MHDCYFIGNGDTYVISSGEQVHSAPKARGRRRRPTQKRRRYQGFQPGDSARTSRFAADCRFSLPLFGNQFVSDGGETIIGSIPIRSRSARAAQVAPASRRAGIIG